MEERKKKPATKYKEEEKNIRRKKGDKRLHDKKNEKYTNNQTTKKYNVNNPWVRWRDECRGKREVTASK